MFRLALDQAERPDPLCAVAVLMLHDSLELHLQLMTEHLNVGRARVGFMEYFELIDDATGTPTPQRESTRRLNKARVALKHHGTLPSRLDVAAFCESTESLLRQTTLAVFGVDFDSLSLAILISDDAVRACLEAADAAIVVQDHKEALARIAEAFARLIASRGLRSWRRRGGWGGIESHEARYQLEHLSEQLHDVRSEVVLMKNGVDTRRLSVFESLVPSVSITVSGEPHVVHVGGRPEPNAEIAHFCYDFVVEAALRMQDFDADVSRIRDHFGREA